MDQQKQTWETYAQAWKEATAAGKREALRRSVAQAATYRDPTKTTATHEELVAYMLDFHRQVPGGWFETTSFRCHHGRSLATWTMRDGADRIIGQGSSYVVYDGDGLLSEMNGFFDSPP
ncbi:MAG: nuclear transport factor 2 family protein [Myxococcales bacterium]|nr:nuclear transport factor 2 family protein [Myxococcales bacterium]